MIDELPHDRVRNESLEGEAAYEAVNPPDHFGAPR